MKWDGYIYEKAIHFHSELVVNLRDIDIKHL